MHKILNKLKSVNKSTVIKGLILAVILVVLNICLYKYTAPYKRGAVQTTIKVIANLLAISVYVITLSLVFGKKEKLSIDTDNAYNEKIKRELFYMTIASVALCLILIPILGMLFTGTLNMEKNFIEKLIYIYEDKELFSKFKAGILLSLVAGLVLFTKSYQNYERNKNSDYNKEHGDSAFMTSKDMPSFNRNFFYDPKILYPDKAEFKKNTMWNDIENKTIAIKPLPTKDQLDKCFTEAQIMGQDVYLSMNTKFLNRNLNTLTIGGSGQGKSYSELFPNALQANCNYVFTDPSGEILQKVGMFLEKECGYSIKIFNIDNFNQSMHYNPLAYVKEDKDYNIFVDAIIDNINQGKDVKGNDFFQKAAKSLFCALCALLKEMYPNEPEKVTLANVMNVLRMAKQEAEDKKGNSSNGKSMLDDIFAQIEEINPRSYAVKQWHDFQVGGIKVCNEVIISLTADLGRYYNNDDIAYLTSKDELDLYELASEKPCALFLIIPQSTPTYNWLVAMIYSQLFDIVTKAGFAYRDKVGGDNPALPRHLSLWLDEFANIGVIPRFNEMLAVVRKYNISINIIVQGMAQLKGLFPQDKHEILLANIDTMIYLGGMEPSTVKWLSEKLGKTTIKSHNYSIGKGSSESYSNMGKNLMSADQIEKLPRSEELIFVSGCKPFKTRKYNLKNHPNAKFCGEFNEEYKLNIASRFKGKSTDIEELEKNTLYRSDLIQYDFKSMQVDERIKKVRIDKLINKYTLKIVEKDNKKEIIAVENGSEINLNSLIAAKHGEADTKSGREQAVIKSQIQELEELEKMFYADAKEEEQSNKQNKQSNTEANIDKTNEEKEKDLNDTKEYFNKTDAEKEEIAGSFIINKNVSAIVGVSTTKAPYIHEFDAFNFNIENEAEFLKNYNLAL